MTDPIGDMLTRIRNAAASGKSDLLLPASKMKIEIAKSAIGSVIQKSAESESSSS